MNKNIGKNLIIIIAVSLFLPGLVFGAALTGKFTDITADKATIKDVYVTEKLDLSGTGQALDVSGVEVVGLTITSDQITGGIPSSMIQGRIPISQIRNLKNANIAKKAKIKRSKIKGLNKQLDSKISNAGGTMEGELDAGGNLIFNPQTAVPDPEEGKIYYNESDNKLYYYNGTAWVDLTTQGQTYTAGSGLTLSGSEFSISNSAITNDMLTGSIAYSKLDLANSVTNADIANAAAVAYSKLDLANSVTNADIANAAVVAYSKLNLAGAVTNGDLAGSIADSKLNQITTANKVAGSAVELATSPGLEDSSGLQVDINGTTLQKDATGLSVNELGASNVADGTLTTADMASDLKCTSRPDSAAEIIADIQGASSGDVVCIAPGSYTITEQLDITVDDLSIIGIGGRDAVHLTFTNDSEKAFYATGALSGSAMGVAAASEGDLSFTCDTAAECNSLTADTLLFIDDTGASTYRQYVMETRAAGSGGAVTLSSIIPSTISAAATIQVVDPLEGLTFKGITISGTAANANTAMDFLYVRDLIMTDVEINTGWRSKIVITKSAEILIDDSYILGNDDDGSAVEFFGVAPRGVFDMQILDTTISEVGSGTYGMGISLYNTPHQIMIEGVNLLSNYGYGIGSWGGGNYIRIANTRIFRSIGWGIMIDNTSGQKGTITGCVVKWNGPADNQNIYANGFANDGNDSS